MRPAIVNFLANLVVASIAALVVASCEGPDWAVVMTAMIVFNCHSASDYVVGKLKK